MDLPDDQEGRLRCYKLVLRNEAKRLVARDPDYIVFKERAQTEVEECLAEYTLRQICCLLHEYVDGGGRIDEQVETRQEYLHRRFHYDLRVRIGGRYIYFETILDFEDADDEDDLTIIVVRVKDV